MKHVNFSLFFLMLISLNAFSQNSDLQGHLRFTWNDANYLFYDTYDLQSLPFEYSVPEEQIQKAVKEIQAIERVEMKNGSGIMYFRTNPLPSDIRKFAEKAGLKEISVNCTRILTSSLLNASEIKKIKEKQIPASTTFQKESNEPGTIENIQFNIQYYSTKIYSMQITHYPRYLYNGTITEYTEKLQEYQTMLNQLTSKN